MKNEKLHFEFSGKDSGDLDYQLTEVVTPQYLAQRGLVTIDGIGDDWNRSVEIDMLGLVSFLVLDKNPITLDDLVDSITTRAKSGYLFKPFHDSDVVRQWITGMYSLFAIGEDEIVQLHPRLTQQNIAWIGCWWAAKYIWYYSLWANKKIDRGYWVRENPLAVCMRYHIRDDDSRKNIVATFPGVQTVIQFMGTK